MSKPFVSLPKATQISTGLLLLGLAIIAYFDAWWPQIMLVIGVSLAVRQILVKKIYDGILSLVIFGGIFATLFYHLPYLPVIFVIAGLYLLFKAASSRGPETEEEEEEETAKEMEEKDK